MRTTAASMAKAIDNNKKQNDRKADLITIAWALFLAGMSSVAIFITMFSIRLIPEWKPDDSIIGPVRGQKKMKRNMRKLILLTKILDLQQKYIRHTSCLLLAYRRVSCSCCIATISSAVSQF